MSSASCNSSTPTKKVALGSLSSYAAAHLDENPRIGKENVIIILLLEFCPQRTPHCDTRTVHWYLALIALVSRDFLIAIGRLFGFCSRSRELV
jgi:hypothetical protein